jgi:peptide/nickel transport system ATP-binding protein
MSESLLQIKNLIVDFQSSGADFRAVNDVSFNIEKGKTVALVGESGSGKSVTALPPATPMAAPFCSKANNS